MSIKTASHQNLTSQINPRKAEAESVQPNEQEIRLMGLPAERMVRECLKEKL